MAQAVYRKSGTIFRAYIDITANPNDTVTVIGPDDYRATFTIESSGTTTAAVKTKGVYTVSGAVSLQTVTIDVQVARARYSANVSFSGILKITGNGGDTVFISGPGSYSKSVKLNSSGTTDIIIVTEPGNYTATGNISNVQASGAASKGNTLALDVAFSCLVKVAANPGANITLTSTTGNNIPPYSAKANASTGIAQVTVRRKTTFTISTDTKTEGSVLSTSPASVSSVNVNNTTTKNITHVRVYSTPNLSSGVWSSRVGYVYYTEKSISDDRFSGMYIRYKANSTPSSLTDGTAFADGKGQSLVISSTVTRIGFTTGELAANTQYYYLGAAYLSVGGIKYYANTKTASWKCVSVSSNGSSVGSGKWSVPAGVRRITVFCVGGGGGGGAGGAKEQSTNVLSWGGPGGGGGYCNSASFNVIPGQQATISVGNGGAGGASARASGANGGASTFTINGSTLTANGGGAGSGGDSYIMPSGSGGSGGGIGGWNNQSIYCHPGNGGSDGGNGGKSVNKKKSTDTWGNPGTGQGSSAVTFNSVVYSGGGGGAMYGTSTNIGYGGNRGGGNGAYYYSATNCSAGANGTDGTGGGGGGGRDTTNRYAGRGGSGAVVISW